MLKRENRMGQEKMSAAIAAKKDYERKTEKRLKIANEILCTEKTYVHVLMTLLDTFRAPLLLVFFFFVFFCSFLFLFL